MWLMLQMVQVPLFFPCTVYGILPTGKCYRTDLIRHFKNQIWEISVGFLNAFGSTCITSDYQRKHQFLLFCNFSDGIQGKNGSHVLSGYHSKDICVVTLECSHLPDTVLIILCVTLTVIYPCCVPIACSLSLIMNKLTFHVFQC